MLYNGSRGRPGDLACLMHCQGANHEPGTPGELEATMKTTTLYTLLAPLTIALFAGCNHSRIDRPDGAFHVTGFAPARGTVKVRADQTIRIRFNVAPAAGSVDATSITVTADDEPVVGRLLTEGDTVTFVPAQLRSGTEYRVTVSGALLGSNGAALGQDVTATFETAHRLRGAASTYVDPAAQAPFKGSKYVYLTRQTEAVLLGADYNGTGKNLFVVDPVEFNHGDATANDEVMYSVEHPSLSNESRKIAAAGNLDRDAYDEVVMVVQVGTAAGAVQVLDGANGDFDLRVLDYRLAIPGVDGGAYRYELALGDVDGDGYDEIVVAAHHDSRSAYLWVIDDKRSGYALLTEKVIPGRDGGAIDDVQLAVADLDGDGRAEIAVANVRTNIDKTFVNPDLALWPELRMQEISWTYEVSVLIIDGLDRDLNTAEQTILRSGTEQYTVFYDVIAQTPVSLFGFRIPVDPRVVVELRAGDVDGDQAAELLLSSRSSEHLDATGIMGIPTSDYAQFVGACQDEARLSIHRFESGQLVTGSTVTRLRNRVCEDEPETSLWSVALDIDGDRRDEVLFGGALHKWNGTELVATGDEVDLEHVEGNEVQTVTGGDVNGDGLEDVMVLRRNGSVAVYGMGRRKTHYDLDWQPVFTYSFSNYTTLRNVNSLANNDHQVLVAANLDDDSYILEPRLVHESDPAQRTVEHRTVFSADRIVAVLAAAPCNGESWQDGRRCRTELVRPTEQKATMDASLLVSSRVMVTSEVDDATAFGGKEAGYLLAGKLADELTRIGRGHQSVDAEALFYRAATGSDDLVVFHTVPYHRYTYTFVSHPEATVRGSRVYISLPLAPRVFSMSRTAYNASNRQATDLDDAVLPHVPGEPTTYLGYDDIAESISNHTDARTVRKDRLPARMRLEMRRQATEQGWVVLNGLGERRLSCGGFHLGFSSGDVLQSSATTSFSSELVAQGSVGAIHETSWDDNRYDYGMFSFITTQTDANQSVTQQFLVVSYYVD